jgi:hypothetical protein
MRSFLERFPVARLSDFPLASDILHASDQVLEERHWE